jgi:hypothetical protein
MSIKGNFLIVFGLGLAWAGSVRAGEAPAASVAGVTVSTAPVEERLIPWYDYKADRFRDPFVPLTGQGAGLSVGVRPEITAPFAPANMELKGVLRTNSTRWAMLRSSDGASYVVEEGKVFDAKRRPVAGYTGIIKEKTVVLIGPDKSVTELLLRRDKEEAEKKAKEKEAEGQTPAGTPAAR